MKKLLTLFLMVCILQANAQNPTYQDKLYYTCKVWGFVKYFHSRVSNCQVNWDSALVSRLPYIKSATTNEDFNNELIKLLNDAGPMTIVPGRLPDTIKPELKRNLDFSWINSPTIRQDVKTVLDTIKNNFRPHTSCYAKMNDFSGSYRSWILYPFDDMAFKYTTYDSFPNEYTRLLLAFKYWNILRYFNPYNYVLDKPIDSTLYNKILLFSKASNITEFYKVIKRIASDLNDAHAEAMTHCSNPSYVHHDYSPQIMLKYIDQKYIVTKTTLDDIKKGDEIISIDGLSTKEMEDSLRPYISVSNSSVFHRQVCKSLLRGLPSSKITIDYLDSNGLTKTLITTRTSQAFSDWFNYFKPNDTLANVIWKKFGCNIGYVNMGNLYSADVNPMYEKLRECNSIIFDLRNYPNLTIWDIANKMFPNKKAYGITMSPDINYPGTFYYEYDYMGIDGNPTPYLGKTIMLVNEESQSQSEFSCMALENMENSITIGSQTAGADANISELYITSDIITGFTNLGAFYLNGDSIQRIGIRPDIVVIPTQEGIRQNRDEVLEKALEVANCHVSINNKEYINSIADIYPNPCKDRFYINLNSTNEVKVDIFDMNGRKVLSKNLKGSAFIDVIDLKNGVYNLVIGTSKTNTSKKLIVLH